MRGIANKAILSAGIEFPLRRCVSDRAEMFCSLDIHVWHKQYWRTPSPQGEKARDEGVLHDR